MPTLPDNPCADGHPELKLLIEVTHLGERLPAYHCNRCGDRLGYEDAIRNDERIKIARRIEEHYLGPDRPSIAAGRAELIEKVAQFCARLARKGGER